MAWPNVLAGKEVLGCLSPVRFSRSQSVGPVLCSPTLLRPQDVQKVHGRTCYSSLRGKQGLEREGGWPLSGPVCPATG